MPVLVQPAAQAFPIRASRMPSHAEAIFSAAAKESTAAFDVRKTSLDPLDKLPTHVAQVISQLHAGSISLLVLDNDPENFIRNDILRRSAIFGRETSYG
jgi:hypothetical protein